MTDPKSPPAPEQQVTLTEAQVLDLMRAEIAGTLGMLAANFAPQVPPDKLALLVEGLLNEQLEIQKTVLPRLVEPGELWIYISAGPGGLDGHFTAKKRFADCGRDPGLAISTALLYAFLLMPGVRGLLRIFGFNYRFQEPKHIDPKRIILNS